MDIVAHWRFLLFWVVWLLPFYHRFAFVSLIFYLGVALILYIYQEEFREKWNKKYPNILKSWDKNWAELTVFFEYPQEIRKIIYTTNAVDGYHRMVRKFTKSKSIFPTDDAIRKVVYMSVSEISKKWTMPVRDWGLAYAQFTIYFEDRFAA